MAYEFGGQLYPTSSKMHLACAAEFLSAGGRNSRDDIITFLAEDTDAKMAKEAWDGWGLGENISDPHDPEWVCKWDMDELVEAFAEIRKNLDEHFPAKDE